MSAPENTKIEQLTEAIESLCIATAVQAVAAVDPHYPVGLHPAEKRNQRRIADARIEVETALRDFLRPTLRVVTQIDKQVGDVKQTITKTIERNGSGDINQQISHSAEIIERGLDRSDDPGPVMPPRRAGHKLECTNDRCYCGPQ